MRVGKWRAKNGNVTSCFGFDATSSRLPPFTSWLRQDLTRELLRAGMDATLPTFAGCFAMDCRKSGHPNVARLRDVSWNLISILVSLVPHPQIMGRRKAPRPQWSTYLHGGGSSIVFYVFPPFCHIRSQCINSNRNKRDIWFSG